MKVVRIICTMVVAVLAAAGSMWPGFVLADRVERLLQPKASATDDEAVTGDGIFLATVAFGTAVAVRWFWRLWPAGDATSA